MSFSTCRFFFVVFFIALLSACGGGGEGGNDASESGGHEGGGDGGNEGGNEGTNVPFVSSGQSLGQYASLKLLSDENYAGLLNRELYR
ncbi:MAG: hypothetical protein OXG05_14340 [Gammaproteobacteria bacterium]|nr:hypothetical protein [Gammaproteobacteria bacterium]